MFFLKSLIAKVFAYIVVRNIENSYEKAANIQIKILEIDEEKKKIICSLKQMRENPYQPYGSL